MVRSHIFLPWSVIPHSTCTTVTHTSPLLHTLSTNLATKMRVHQLLNYTSTTTADHPRSAKRYCFDHKCTMSPSSAAHYSKSSLTFDGMLCTTRQAIDSPLLPSSLHSHVSSPSCIASTNSTDLVQADQGSVAQPNSCMPYPTQSSYTAAPASRLAQSRIVGRRHRRKQSQSLQSLQLDVEELRVENDRLQSLLAREPDSAIGNISGRAALLLLEFITIRRNLIAIGPAPCSLSPEGGVLRNAIVHAKADLDTLDQVASAHRVWAASEGNSVHMLQRRIFTKTCSRCHKSRSGYGRSTCDDGFKVASLISYPASNNLLR